MSMKYLILFVSTSIIVLMSLNAIAGDVTTATSYTETSVITASDQEKSCPNHVDQNQELLCNKEKANTKKSTQSTLKESARDSVNLSFNFIYYILYKFKYIDIFELLRN